MSVRGRSGVREAVNLGPEELAMLEKQGYVEIGDTLYVAVPFDLGALEKVAVRLMLKLYGKRVPMHDDGRVERAFDRLLREVEKEAEELEEDPEVDL